QPDGRCGTDRCAECEGPQQAEPRGARADPRGVDDHVAAPGRQRDSRHDALRTSPALWLHRGDRSDTTPVELVDGRECDTQRDAERHGVRDSDTDRRDRTNASPANGSAGAHARTATATDFDSAADAEPHTAADTGPDSVAAANAE